MEKYKTLVCIIFSFLCFQVLEAQCPPNLQPINVIMEIDLSGHNSWDLEGDINNEVFTICDPAVANAFFDELGWAITDWDALNPSECADFIFEIEDVLEIQPSIQTSSGECEAVSTIHLMDISMYNIMADENGCITIELFEAPGEDDNANAIDTQILNGTIFLHGVQCIEPIPTLGQWGLILLGLVLMIFGIVSVRNHVTRRRIVKS